MGALVFSSRDLRRGEATLSPHPQKARPLLGVVVAGAAFLVFTLLALAAPGIASAATISSTGPLTEITISEELNCDVRHAGDTDPEFYGATACGTFLAVGGTLFGPSAIPAGGAATPRTPFTPVSQTAVLGSGTAADPYRIVTVVDLGTTGLRISETDSYVVGEETYRTDVEISNSGASDQSFLLYRAGDCFLQNSDFGFGRIDTFTGAVACRAGVDDGTGNIVPGTRIEQWFPLTAGSSHMEAGFNDVWARIGSQQPFPNTCDCASYIDNGAGLSWAVTVAAAGAVTVSHLTVFSPLGVVPLSTSKTADQPTAQPGTTDGYTITVTNPNTSAVTLDSITDTLPAGFTYVPGSTSGATGADPSISGQALTWTGPFAVPAGGNVSLHFNVTVSSVSGDYLNEATAAATGFTVAPSGLTAKITVTSGGGVDLSMTKADAPDPVTVGGTLTYTLTVTNNGPDPSTDSTVTDTLPAGVTFVSATPSQGTCSQAAGTVTCTLGPLAVGASATIAIVVTVDATAVCPLSDTATVAGVETDPLAANNSATASTACGGGTDLAITKADAPDPVTVGGTLTYTLTVTNNGPDPSTDSTVTDTLPAGVTFVSATPSQGSCAQAGGTVTCTLGPLAVGASATIAIVVTVDATAASPLSDTATVAGVETDPVAGNDSATAETTISLPVGLDHFKCYQTKQVGAKFDSRQVVLTDQFNTERVKVVRPGAFCNPADKDGSGIGDPTAHLACYKIRDVKGDEFPKFKQQAVEVTNQFGTQTLLLKRIRSLCVPSSKSPSGEVPGPPPTSLDHFKCYKTKQVGARFDPRQVVLADQFNTERVNVVRPEAFCAPVDKDGSGINDPSAHLACYKIRDVRGDEFPKFERRRIEATDQFWTHTLLLKKTRTLCVPSSKTVL